MSAIRESVRSMLLPISPEREVQVVEETKIKLQQLNVEETDQAIWIDLELNKWQETGYPTAELESIISLALTNGDPDYGAVLSQEYFKIHNDLIRRSGLNHNEATNILSQAGLIARLAETDKMSSAQITNVLSTRYRRSVYDWKHVARVLTGLNLEPKLDAVLVDQLIERDEELEEATLADLDASSAAIIVSNVANRLGFPEDLEQHLRTLLFENPEGKPFGPYLQMLFYQCIIAEFFDHPVTVLYEFSPRGVIANSTFERFPPELEVAGAPFLNNAKSVSQLDINWAHSKKEGKLVEAKALVKILSGLENMGFAARRELASWIRRWILRIIRIAIPLTNNVNEAVSLAQVQNLISHASQNQTNTTGIIEQRLVDFNSLFSPRNVGWRVRGIGDSVNASNVSRKKLGDVDYQDAGQKIAIAYEAHAGKLTEVYIQEHIRTLQKVIKLRSLEWSGISDPSEWAVKVIFIAHDITAVQNRVVVIEGVRVEFSYLTFGQFFNEVQLEQKHLPDFVEYVIKRINEKRTPNSVRNKFSSLL